MSQTLIHSNVLNENVKKTASQSPSASIKEFIQTAKAKKQAKKILAGIHEAEKIHAGKKQGQSFEDFLTEL